MSHSFTGRPKSKSYLKKGYGNFTNIINCFTLIQELNNLKAHLKLTKQYQKTATPNGESNPEKKFGADPSCRFREKRTFNSEK